MDHGSSDGVPGTRRIRATPLPVSIALAGHTNDWVLRNVIATSITAQAEDGGEDPRHADLEAEPELPEDVDGDDDRGDVQARVAGLRQEHGVGSPAERERPAGHILPPLARSSGASYDRRRSAAAGARARAGDGLPFARSAAGVRPWLIEKGRVDARSSMGTARYGRSPGNGRMWQ